MKTSNILMMTALLIFLSTLVVYDLGLKAENHKITKLGLTEYKKANRFNDYEQLEVKNFNTIDVKAANALHVVVEYGEKEAVWIRKYNKEMVEVLQAGNNLIIDLSKKGKAEKNHSAYYLSIVIISPEIKSINSTAFKHTDNETLIKGFKQNLLNLNISAATKIRLDNNHIKSVNANIGDKSGDGALIISSDNTIESLKLEVLGKSRAEVLAANIQNFEHQISDSATVTFRGITLTKIK